MIKFVIPVLALLVLAIGCQPQEAAAPSDPKNVGNNATTEVAGTSTLIKCAECGKEVDQSLVVAHGDVKICKDCEAKHGH